MGGASPWRLYGQARIWLHPAIECVRSAPLTLWRKQKITAVRNSTETARSVSESGAAESSAARGFSATVLLHVGDCRSEPIRIERRQRADALRAGECRGLLELRIGDIRVGKRSFALVPPIETLVERWDSAGGGVQRLRLVIVLVPDNRDVRRLGAKTRRRRAGGREAALASRARYRTADSAARAPRGRGRCRAPDSDRGG